MAGDDTEAERRTALRQAITERDQAKAAATQADAAHARARTNFERTRALVNGFEGLDTEIEQHTISALRQGEPAGLPDALADKVTARERAIRDLITADRAVDVLGQELSEATQRAEQCDAVVTAAVHAMTLPERQRLRNKARRLKTKGAAIEQAAGWSDSAEPWRGICDALLADPENASVTIADDALPDEPVAVEPPRPPVFIMPPDQITVFKADGTQEVVSGAEMVRREREARIAAAANPVTEAMAIEAARMQARKLAG
jgi:hypothetical protein